MSQKSLEYRREMQRHPNTFRSRVYHAMRDRASWELLLLCVPTLVFMVLFHDVPFFSGLALPFKNYRPRDGIWGSAWCGLKNFRWIASSPYLWRALRNSVLYGLWGMIYGPIVNVGMALLLFDVSNKVAIRVYRTAICLPMFMSIVVINFILFTFTSPRFGIINRLLETMGMARIDVYSMPIAWPFIFTIVGIWSGIGGGSLLYYATLTGIDGELFEAAAIDGATHWQRTWNISIPHLIPIVALGLIMGIGGILGGSFDKHYILTSNASVLYSTTDILPTFVTRALLDGDLTKSAASSFMTGTATTFLVIVTNQIVRWISPENSMF